MSMNSASKSVEHPAPSPRRSVPLGLFILFQLVFLAVNNFFGFIQDTRGNIAPEYRPAVEQFVPGWSAKKGYTWDVVEGASHLSQRWAQATLQLQTWSLFAPNISKECAFPALLLSDVERDSFFREGDGYRTADHGRLVLSDNEPGNLKSYLRWGNFRLRRYENNLVLYLSRWPEETPPETAERWRNAIKEHAGGSKGTEAMFLAYLRFRTDQVKNAAETPRQVTLLMRHYDLKAPEAGPEFVEGPLTVPILRWLPARGDSLDLFNPVTGHFEPLHP